MVFTDLPLSQEFKTMGMDDYLWVQALFNHEELERLRGVEPTDPHQRFLWRIIRMCETSAQDFSSGFGHSRSQV